MVNSLNYESADHFDIFQNMANFHPKKQWRFKHQWMESGKVLMKFFK
jgi:hypothetical protein